MATILRAQPPRVEHLAPPHGGTHHSLAEIAALIGGTPVHVIRLRQMPTSADGRVFEVLIARFAPAGALPTNDLASALLDEAGVVGDTEVCGDAAHCMHVQLAAGEAFL